MVKRIFVTAAAVIALPLAGLAGDAPAPTAPPALPALTERLKRHVTALAGDIGERNVLRYGALEKAAAYLRHELGALGYRVREQPYQADGKVVRNLEVELAGSRDIVVIGAHYDTVAGSPGANDNATGVALLLELARMLKGEKTAKTVRFVLFVNEEPPFFKTDLMGSRVYARACRRNGDDIVGMISLETLGWYSDLPGSQSYPFPLGLRYPSRGNYVGFIGDSGSRTFMNRVLASFRAHTSFPAEGLAAPAMLPGVDWSDHWSFRQEGYQAIMITDTAPYRYPHYHAASDTPDKIRYDKLAAVADALFHVIRDLSSGA